MKGKEMTEIQYCEDCENCIPCELNEADRFILARCKKVKYNTRTNRVSRQLESKYQFCELIRGKDTCENYKKSECK